MLDRRGPGVKQFFCKREVRRRRFGRSRSSRTREGGRRQPPRCRGRARAAGSSRLRRSPCARRRSAILGPRAPFGASESAKAASADFRAAGSGRAGHGRAAFVGRVAPRGARRSVTPRARTRPNASMSFWCAARPSKAAPRTKKRQGGQLPRRRRAVTPRRSLAIAGRGRAKRGGAKSAHAAHSRASAARRRGGSAAAGVCALSATRSSRA